MGLPGDPWLAPPGLLSALPGFLAAPHAGYPSYLTSPRRLPSPPSIASSGNNGTTTVQGKQPRYHHQLPKRQDLLFINQQEQLIIEGIAFDAVGTLSAGMGSLTGNNNGHVQSPSPTGHDPRTTSIQALRLRAKEHVESISKGLQMV